MATAIMASAGELKAQVVRPLLGKLVVRTPRGVLPSDDYWIYVNSQIVSAPPHKKATLPIHSSYIHVGGTKDNPYHQYWDRDGEVAASKNGRMTYIRAGMRDQIFEDETFRLAPGSYKVELLTRAIQLDGFPFTAFADKARIIAGKTTTLEFGVPPDTDEGSRAYRAARAYIGQSKQQNLDMILDDLNHSIKLFEADPIVAPLDKVLLNLMVSPPAQPFVYADLPDSMGGGRSLDARQITLIVDMLETNYSFSDNGCLQASADANPNLAEYIGERLASHTKRIARYREITKSLEQVKRP